MGVGDDVHQFARLQPCRPREHHQEDAVLHHVPVARRQHILAALVQNAVEGVPRDVEGHGIGARVQVHVFEVRHVVHVRDDAAAGGGMLQIIQHFVHLVELPFREIVLDAQLIAVRLADAAALVRPAVPDMRREIADVVALLLPDP